MLSAICLNLDQSKILLFGNGLTLAQKTNVRQFPNLMKMEESSQNR